MLRHIATIGCLMAVFIFASPSTRAGDVTVAKESEGEHKAAHGGCLNALTACENGHAEVKLEGDTLKVWFVGGGSDTEKAVRIPDKEVLLAITLDGAKTNHTLVLKAKPSALAEEKEGDCSHFAGRADWLKDVHKFIATGTVTFKGRQQAIRIEFPAGFDPDDDDAPATKK